VCLVLSVPLTLLLVIPCSFKLLLKLLPRSDVFSVATGLWVGMGRLLRRVEQRVGVGGSTREGRVRSGMADSRSWWGGGVEERGLEERVRRARRSADSVADMLVEEWSCAIVVRAVVWVGVRESSSESGGRMVGMGEEAVCLSPLVAGGGLLEDCTLRRWEREKEQRTGTISKPDTRVSHTNATRATRATRATNV